MKKANFLKLLLVFFFLSSFISFQLVNANFSESEKEAIHFFEDPGCPACARQKEFLKENIVDNYPNIEINYYSIRSSENQEKFHQMMAERGIENYILSIPTTFIGDIYFQGFYEADKELIYRAIIGEKIQREFDLIREDPIVWVPFVGEINVGNWALPVTAFTLGNLDGLNVCSIGALILILTIVLSAFKSRKKIFFYGGLFIFTSVVIYGALVFAWTALFDKLATIIGPINTIIGILASIGGLYFLSKFIKFYKYGPACDYRGNKFLIKVTKRVKSAFQESGSRKSFFVLVTSVVIFATIVTLVELPCSIGLPMIYGGILARSGLSWIGYASYIVLYLFFYMLIELIIFSGAVLTREVWFAESKFITWIYLLGTIILFFLSYYYLIGI